MRTHNLFLFNKNKKKNITIFHPKFYILKAYFVCLVILYIYFFLSFPFSTLKLQSYFSVFLSL